MHSSQQTMRWYPILFLVAIGVSLLFLDADFASGIVQHVLKAGNDGEAAVGVPISDRSTNPLILEKRDYKEREKPLLILHVGPPKTGTTTIQAFAIQYRSMLQEDNVYFVGNGKFRGAYCTHELVRRCRNGSQTDCRAAWNEFGQLLDYHHSLNHTVFVSEENFSGFNPKLEENRLYRYLIPLARKWNVHVIFTYRRHYASVASKYMQLHNPAKKDCYKVWPDMGGEEIPSFASFLTLWEENRPFYEPVAVKTRWHDHFVDQQVSLYNFHSEAPLLQSFFCQMIPQAPRVCQLLMEQKLTLKNNPSSSKHLHYDMIAVAAYEHGLVNATLSRTYVTRAVQGHARLLGLEHLTDFPLEQPTTRQVQALLEHSLQVEQTLIPDFYSEADIESGFRQYLQEGRLSSVDTKAVLKDPRWRSFFSQL